VHALRPAGLDRARHPDVGERLAHEPGGGDRRRERAALGRVDVQHQVAGTVPVLGVDQRHVVLDGALVREPEE
jgi:hypothetical protein